jgi:hypothetical protein
MSRVLAVSITLITGLVVVVGLHADETSSRRARAVLLDPRCPQAQVAQPRPAQRIVRVLRRQASRFESAEVLRHFRLDAIFPLARDRFAPGLRRGRYLRIARRACGETVARRPWIVVIDMPNAPAADLGLLALFFTRTTDGWKAWQGWLPNSAHSERGFFPRE